MTSAIGQPDREALSAMLDLALAKAQGQRQNGLMLDYGLPKATPEAEILAKAGATPWTADRSFLKATWYPAGRGAQVAQHPEGESVTEPPGSLVCSARLP